MVMLTLFLLFLINSKIQSKKLTTEENELNSKKCGVHFLGQPIQRNHVVKKSIGGREFEENEYPWTVILQQTETLCSGAQISQRHILTAAHCVLDVNDGERRRLCAMNQSHSIVLLLVEPKDVTVLIGGGKMRCDVLPCQFNKNVYKVEKITTMELGMCNLKDDLALIELSQDILESDSTPICMPEDGLQLQLVLYASGFGIDPSSPITFDNPDGQHSHGQQVVALRYDTVDQSLHKIQTKTFQKTMLPGDSGGPLFQVNEEGRHVLVGIFSSFLSRPAPPQNALNYFTDVRDYLDWICKHSGVCPVEEELQQGKGAIKPYYSVSHI